MKKLMTPYLEWDQDSKRLEIYSEQELDSIVDRLTDSAIQEGRPMSIELYVSTETCLSIGIGRIESHVEFYDATKKPPIVACCGLWDSDELLVFFHRGTYSEMPKCYCIPIEEAREALREYFRTGQQPQNITWC